MRCQDNSSVGDDWKLDRAARELMVFTQHLVGGCGAPGSQARGAFQGRRIRQIRSGHLLVVPDREE